MIKCFWCFHIVGNITYYISFVRLWACAVLALHPRGGVSFSLSSRQSLYVPDLHRDRQLRRHNLRAQYPKLQLIIRGRPKLGLGLMKRGLTDRERRKKDEAKQQEDILLDGCPDGTLGLCKENTVVKEGKMKCMKKWSTGSWTKGKSSQL